MVGHGVLLPIFTRDARKNGLNTNYLEKEILEFG